MWQYKKFEHHSPCNHMTKARYMEKRKKKIKTNALHCTLNLINMLNS